MAFFCFYYELNSTKLSRRYFFLEKNWLDAFSRGQKK